MIDAQNSHNKIKPEPDIIIIDVLSNLYVPVIFSHQLHAEMSDMFGGCQICHHHNPLGAILVCKDCHLKVDYSLNPQCGECHKKDINFPQKLRENE